jgi:hypothetical protein
MTVPTATLAFEPRAASVGDYFALLKPRVMSLVLFTALAGMVLAPAWPGPLTAFTALLCIAVGAGASGALNMAYDSDIDALMTRTATRPVPMGRVAKGDALAFGWTLAAGSVAVMALFVNSLAAGTEHRHRRSRGLSSAGNRLGRRNGNPGTCTASFGSDHLSLDAAAFLGARALPLR